MDIPTSIHIWEKDIHICEPRGTYVNTQNSCWFTYVNTPKQNFQKWYSHMWVSSHMWAFTNFYSHFASNQCSHMWESYSHMWEIILTYGNICSFMWILVSSYRKILIEGEWSKIFKLFLQIIINMIILEFSTIFFFS